jgi:hypothetical protein
MTVFVRDDVLSAKDDYAHNVIYELRHSRNKIVWNDFEQTKDLTRRAESMGGRSNAGVQCLVLSDQQNQLLRCRGTCCKH